MKLIFILLFGVGVMGAPSEKCTPLYNNSNETFPCLGIKNGTSIFVDKNDCDDFPHCCILKNATCVIRAEEQSGVNVSISKAENDELSENANKTVGNAINEFEVSTVEARSLIIGSPLIPPGLSQKCIPPVPFPGNCKPTRNEPYVLEPPVNIPYCLRIPCNHLNNKMYEKSQRACGMQPGCYFDKELYEYREAFGDSVLPGVPVCHLAIRNRFFQVKARTVVEKYGSWNPYFTNCLLKEFEDEISKGPAGCELLPILDAFYVTPKLAGWSTINSDDCARIDGCWRHSGGCFYPVDIKKVRIKSGQRPILFGAKEITFGRPKCQHFDVSSPLNILKSYHRCLSAGCSVDSSVTYLYFNLLYSVGDKLTVEQHWRYWDDVEKGLVGAFNLGQIIEEYGYDSIIVEPPITPNTPTTTGLFDFPTWPPGNGGPQPPKPSSFPGFMPKKPVSNNLLGGYLPPKKVDRCGFHFRSYGYRPCAPPVFQPQSNNRCPYKPFSVPRFPTLKGSFDGCCDINLCYLPKSEISKMHSGPSHYYSEWSLFSECSASCGVGVQKRSRRCISEDRKLCNQKFEETKSCKIKDCPEWTDWDQWSPCSDTCGIGLIQSRKRICLPPGSHCEGSAEETRPCNLDACPGHGGGGGGGNGVGGGGWWWPN